MQADLETIRIAELYASHPLLRTLPVPHLRLPDVMVDIPMLIDEVEQPRPGESPRGGVPKEGLRGRFQDLLASHLSASAVALSAAERRRLNLAIDERLDAVDVPEAVNVDVNRIADDLVDTALGIVAELRPANADGTPAVDPGIAAALRAATRLDFLKLRTEPPRLSVLVTAAELRDATNAENVTRLHLKISEEGVEWTSIESAGTVRNRLVPE
jgi:hypothetical protein